MDVCQLLIDPPADGAWNMAVDEALLEAVECEPACWWRFYQWAEPTLSLGYFQEYAERAGHPASRHAACVRRLTGGGAILHDRELTYSLIVPAQHRLAQARERLYAIVHRSLVELLADLAVTAGLHPASSDAVPAPEPFLCFQRRAPGDIVTGDVKITGSAQRRRRGAVLQHGSILLQRSAAAPELPGIAEKAGPEIDAARLIDAWLPRLAESLELQWQPAALSPQQRQAAEELRQRRYAAAAWTVHRGRG